VFDIDDEIKLSRYTQTLHDRTALFRRMQKTSKDLRCTFITVYGVKQNKYSGIVDHQLKLDDLFTA